MHNADLITPQHLARKAVIDIRQSTPHQVVSHQESLRLQYALGARAHQLGWPDEAIDIIDDDLGLTAATAHHRPGFNTLVAQVTLEQVGLILSYDVTRLSRNCSDWYPLLDLCGYKGCLIADGDGIYDPATVNGRLLLGLKGTLSEWERHTMKARLTAGLIQKATRGELALTLPTGLVRNGQGTVHKIPNQEAQARLSLVFETFLQCRSASKVVEVFNTHDLLLPRRNRFGDLVWKAPRVAAVLSILKHPAYAGAFTYGRSRTLRREATQARPSITRLPQEQWRICLPDVYPPYISWETYLQIQTMLKDNHAEYDRNKTRGIPRPGKALLHGLVYCAGWSPAGNAATRWWCSIRAAPATSVTTSGNSIELPCVNILRPIPLIRGWSTRFCRPSRPWSSMCMSKRWPSGSSRPNASPKPTPSISSGCAMRPPIVSANSATSIPSIAMSRPNWNTRGRWRCRRSSRPKPLSSSALRPARPPPARCPPRGKRPSAPSARSSRNSGPATCCLRPSARPYCVVSSTRWSSSGRGAIRFTPALSGVAARPPRLRSPWLSGPSPTCQARTRWRNRFGCSLPRVQAMTR